MIEQTGSAGARCLKGSGKGAPVNGVFVECAIEPPAYQFENLFEVPRLSRRSRHSSSQRRIKVSVGADHSRQYEFSAEIDDNILVQGIKLSPALNNKSGIDPKVCALDRRRVETYQGS